MLTCQQKIILLLAGVLMGVNAHGQNPIWIQTTNAFPADYVASSSDGSRLVAVGGGIYTSTNYGISWTQQTSAPFIYDWSCVASSSDGSKLVAAQYGGFIYTSTNYGVEWTPQSNAGSNYWYCVASSGDGSHLIAGQGGPVGLGYADGYVYTSSDNGVTWTQQTRLGLNWWYCVASSFDGSRLVADDIYSSTNYGVTWTNQSTWPGGNYFASSSDGSHLVAVNGGGPIYTSTNYGVTWTHQTNAPNALWESVASSADGSNLIIAGYIGSYFNGSIYISTDYGYTWTQQQGAGLGFWEYVAISSDGGHLIAGQNGGYVYTAQYLERFNCFTSMVNGSLSLNLQYNGTPNLVYVLDSVTNLNLPANWQPVVTNLADTNGVWTFTDTNVASTSARFYRASVPPH